MYSAILRHLFIDSGRPWEIGLKPDPLSLIGIHVAPKMNGCTAKCECHSYAAQFQSWYPHSGNSGRAPIRFRVSGLAFVLLVADLRELTSSQVGATRPLWKEFPSGRVLA